MLERKRGRWIAEGGWREYGRRSKRRDEGKVIVGTVFFLMAGIWRNDSWHHMAFQKLRAGGRPCTVSFPLSSASHLPPVTQATSPHPHPLPLLHLTTGISTTSYTIHPETIQLRNSTTFQLQSTGGTLYPQTVCKPSFHLPQKTWGTIGTF